MQRCSRTCQSLLVQYLPDSLFVNSPKVFNHYRVSGDTGFVGFFGHTLRESLFLFLPVTNTKIEHS